MTLAPRTDASARNPVLRSAARRRLPAALLLGTVALALTGGRAGCPIASPELEAPPWPQWVHRHWVWENEGDQASALALVDDYLARKIPVGAVIIDRPWEVEPTSFVPDPARYPDLGQLVDDFHARDVRVFLWAVSMINENAETYAEAKANGYLLNDGATVEWWAGRGSLLDYTNPAAVAWWHGRMDAILDLGIDGWKCDATDPTVLLLPGGAVGAGGPITWPEYRDAYYRDFFEYTRSRLGPDRVITARPSDSYIGLPVPVPFAPRDVNFAGWVGDQDGDFGGLRAALANMRASSWLKYVSFGSDIGGFRSPESKEVLIRWAELGALCPIMENGGGGEHRPWMYDAETTDIYRTFAVLHTELVRYLYSQGARSWEQDRSTMRFQDAHSFRLGDAFFVAAMVEPGTARTVTFPAGDRWIDWLDETAVHEGGTTVDLDVPLDRFPVFVREGALVPLDVADAATGHGGPFSEGHLTIAAYAPAAGSTTFDLYAEGGGGTRFRMSAGSGVLELDSSPIDEPLLWRVRGRSAPTELLSDIGPAPVPVASTADLSSAPRTWTVDAAGTIWIRVADPADGVSLTLPADG